jgi:hypothetical protein
MNERIQSFAEQATLLYQTMDGEWEEDFDKAKFAELIVRECADIATMNQYQPFTAGVYVLKHFGMGVE